MTTAPTDTTARQRVRARRVGHAVLIAGLSTLIAAVAHATAGGGWPNAVTLIAALVLSTFLTTPVVGTHMRGWRVAVAVAVDQLVFHVLFATVGAATALPGAAHAHHDPILTFALGAESSAVGLGMGAHHVIAALASFGLLRGGWALLLAALSAGAELLIRAFRPAPSVAPRTRAPRLVSAPSLPSPLAILRHRLQRRGPPVLVALG